MDSQPPSRTLFRLLSQIRQDPAPQPQPPVTQTRAPLLRTASQQAIRPPTVPPQPEPQPQPQPQPPPPPPTAQPRVPAQSTVPSAQVVETPSTPKLTSTSSTSSLPSSPITKVSTSSVPSSPVTKASTAPLPSSPVTKTSTASLPSSPLTKTSTASLPSSPVTKASTAPLPSSPVTKASTAPQPSSPVPKTSTAPQPSSPVPKTSTASLPSSPITKTSTVTQPSPPPATTKTSSSSLTTSPKLETVVHVPTPPPKSPQIIKSFQQIQPQSPTTKLSAPPTSLSSPPSHPLKADPEPETKPPLVAEQKNVVVQETHKTMPGSTTENLLSKVGEGRPSSNQKDVRKKSEAGSAEGGMKVITISGENKGAYMELGYFNKKKLQENKGNPHRLRSGSSSSSDQSGNSSSSDDDGKTKKNGNTAATPGKKQLPVYVNSNVQGINNSILYNTTFAHHDPGIHLSLSRKPFSNQDQTATHANGHSHGGNT